ncbi:hypothetical protein QNI19_16580 [Cytophagaceae bacterium DM2B3-1]|uniref:Uncharacterized protein n=1 Tax=Xanthocytophaga flava TaxID=3048013 RepID=A0ABT7CLJ0_9BACT|nr:hypothetical protein [Xanthocytophaga flavus]MDJ1494563.1 hypothetical protein [Xanthocytophaga flavus]
MSAVSILNTVNEIEKRFYSQLPYSLKDELRNLYCDRFKKSGRTFRYRLQNVNFSAPERAMWSEFAAKYNVVLYPPTDAQEIEPEVPGEQAG